MIRAILQKGGLRFILGPPIVATKINMVKYVIILNWVHHRLLRLPVNYKASLKGNALISNKLLHSGTIW